MYDFAKINSSENVQLKRSYVQFLQGNINFFLSHDPRTLKVPTQQLSIELNSQKMYRKENVQAN
jgi:hypothetical protein